MKTLSVDSIEEAVERAYTEGWTDGLPVVPPTVPLVEKALEYLGVDPQETLGNVPPKHGRATYEKVVANCVMAGCRPEHMPVVIAAVRAMLQDRFNLNGVQATTNSVAPLVIVSGPVVKQLGFNSRCGVFGGGSRANATVGRAVRLVLWNIGGGYPGKIDMSTMGHPGKYTFCIAEDPEWNPWTPLHVERGLKPEDSAVTVVATDGPQQIGTGSGYGSAEEVLTTLADAMAAIGNSTMNAGGDMVLVVGPMTAQALASRGYTKESMREALQERARKPVRLARQCLFYQPSHPYHWSHAIPHPDDPDAMVPLIRDVKQLVVTVAGGMGSGTGFCSFLPGWHHGGGLACTEKIQFPD
ncbi:MAG TPA: hypothetical protein VNJ12_00220 [Candidatus Dormibacteraeota bacterium]|nr:hypothetical protein [Candidatus Dormibacteraeota bacterium]